MRIVIGVPADILVEGMIGRIELEDSCDRVIEKLAVMGHYQDSSRKIADEFFEPIQTLEVQVVGRLIKNQEARPGHEDFGKSQTGFLSPAEFLDFSGMFYFLHTYFIERVFDFFRIGKFKETFNRVLIPHG